MNTETLERVKCPICDLDETRYLFTKDSLSIVECRHCGLRYVNPRVNAQSLGTSYVESYYPQEKIRQIQNSVLEHLRVEERLDEIERRILIRGRLLDVGCGIGTFLNLAGKRGWEIYGVDLSESAIAFAKSQYGIEVFCGELFEAKLPTHYYDVITLYHVLEHIPWLTQFLDELCRILKKSGWLVIEVPNDGSLQSRLKKEKWPYVHPRDHLYYFSNRTLTKLLRKHGFSQIQFGKPKRVNPDKGFINDIKFAFRRTITFALANFHLGISIRAYAKYLNSDGG